jgi:hypothetical protein
MFMIIDLIMCEYSSQAEGWGLASQ